MTMQLFVISRQMKNYVQNMVSWFNMIEIDMWDNKCTFGIHLLFSNYRFDSIRFHPFYLFYSILFCSIPSNLIYSVLFYSNYQFNLIRSYWIDCVYQYLLGFFFKKKSIGITEEMVVPFKVVPIIEVPGYGNTSAVKACKQVR